MRKGKKENFLFSVLIIIFISFPIFGYCQEPLESQIQISVSAQVEEEEHPPPAPPWGPFPPSPAIVVFEGRAYPNAFLTILKNGQTAATFFALPSGFFKKELTGVKAGIYTFGIWAEDTAGRKSVTLSFTVSILEGMTTTISGIFISPTIELLPVQVERGGDINIFGQVFPESKVYIFVLPIALTIETIGSREGNWSLKLDTSSLEIGEYKVKTKAFFGEGEQSEFSEEIPFEVAIICKGADLNFDGAINVFDFSILLHWWEVRNPLHPCVDINFDKIVDVIDFSVMMHYWAD